MLTVRGPGGVLTYESTIDIGAAPKVVLVRCWKVNEEKMRAFLAHWHQMRSLFPFEMIILAIDGDLDDGSTLRSFEACGNPSYVVPIFVTGPKEVRNWTRMLNAMLEFLHLCGVTDGMFMIASFDAGFDFASREALLDLDPNHPVPAVGFRRSVPDGCSPGIQEFLGQLEANPLRVMEERRERVADFICSPQLQTAGEWADQTLFTIRNTFMLWSGAPLFAIGGFDSFCNAAGGQEDFAAFARMDMSNIVGRLDRAFAYSDTRVSDGTLTHLGENPMQKITREIGAVHKVLALYHSEFQSWNKQGIWRIPENRMDFTW